MSKIELDAIEEAKKAIDDEMKNGPKPQSVTANLPSFYKERAAQAGKSNLVDSDSGVIDNLLSKIGRKPQRGQDLASIQSQSPQSDSKDDIGTPAKTSSSPTTPESVNTESKNLAPKSFSERKLCKEELETGDTYCSFIHNRFESSLTDFSSLY
jgi:hypothetical protein